MKFDFYCSYNLSAVGFRRVEVDLSAGTQKIINSGDGVVGKLMTVAGAKSAFGHDASNYYLVLKNIKAIDKEKSIDTAGHTWYINVAVRADKSELDRLCALIYFAYTDFDAFTDIIVNTLSVSSGSIPFSVDINPLNELETEAAKRFARFEKTKTVQFISGPYECSEKELSAALEAVTAKKLSKLYEFVIPENDMEYFNEMFSGNRHSYHDRGTREVSKKADTTSDFLNNVSDFAGNHRNEIIIGSAAAGGIYCAYRVLKFIKRKKRKEF